MEGLKMVVVTNNDTPTEDKDRNFPKELLAEWDRVCAELKKLSAVKKPRK